MANEIHWCGFGTRGTRNYDAPEIAMRNERPGDEYHSSYGLVAGVNPSGKYLTWR